MKLHPHAERSPTDIDFHLYPTASADSLSPYTFSAQERLTSELLRTL